jgi:ribosomal protein L30E
MNDIKVKVIIKANNFELHLTEDYKYSNLLSNLKIISFEVKLV